MSYEKLTDALQCNRCGKAHLRKDRVWKVRRDKMRVSVCPSCGDKYFLDITKKLTMP